MNNNYKVYLTNLIDYLNGVDTGAISAFLFGLACILLGFYLVRKASRDKLLEILNRKKIVGNIISELLGNLEKIEQLDNTLINQKNIIESYENETINQCLAITNIILTDPNKYNILNNQKLETQIKFYFNGQRKMLRELLSLEDESYSFQKEYQQRVIYYNREYEKLKETLKDEELLLDYKKDILAELEFIKENVIIALKNLKYKRDDFYKELNTSLKLGKDLRIAIVTFRNKEVAPKRFYLRYLAFV